MALATTKWEIMDYLDNPTIIAEYINAALESEDPELIKTALGDVARARGMTQLSKDTGLAREALYRALSEKGDPKLSTLFGVMKALGIQLSAKPAR